ncbi:cytochrome P450 2F2-like [Hippoglossus stenolepis]|uniref:cytochrome P450 2F2-like n=1 Tax=Hippoglossus stenolepis TaxID=195615 RepID=UPI001FAF8164|nr:cytochrome P450 2F2-like [Hippoglossus stenolepis]
MLVSIILLCVCVWFIILQLKSRRPKNFPPGPPALPVLGNLLHLSLENPLKDFERLRKKYGDVYSLFLGPKPMVIINGQNVIKEALVTKGIDFAGRPDDLFVNDVTQRRGVVLANFGASWRDHRRFALSTMRNFGMGKNSMADRIHGELQYIVEAMEKNVGKIVNPAILVYNTASNIICQVLFGTRFEYDDEFIKVIVQCFRENAKMANGPWAMMYDSFPLIRNLPLPFVKAFENFKVAVKYVRQFLDEHKKTRVPGDPRDLVDCYLDELDKRAGEDSPFSEEELISNSLDLHFGGTDTTSNTLLTAFLYLMAYPHVQERCQQEIDEVLEGKHSVTYDDRHNMPYMQAMIHEVQRIGNIVPLSVFHSTTKDTELMGYSIPRGTLVIPNLGTALKEEGQWKFPHEFNPENFLNDKGEFFKPEAFLPFSAGPRMCLGEGLARMELFFTLVTLLRKFKFVWPQDAGEPDLTPVYGITLSPKPYCMNVQLRATQ